MVGRKALLQAFWLMRSRGMVSSTGLDTARDRLERVMGIEPTLAAWEAAVLPLNYTRVDS